MHLSDDPRAVITSPGAIPAADVMHSRIWRMTSLNSFSVDRLRKRSIACWLFVQAAVAVFTAESDNVTPWRQDQPPNPPSSPQEAIAKMSVPNGFTVELVASEPDLVNPIAMSFDDRGRIWITE